MEQEGIVSVWVGFFENEDILMAYAAEEGYDSEGTPEISPFNQDFFGGENLWPFDPDFWERALVKTTTDVEALVEPFSEGVTIGEGLKELFPQGLAVTFLGAVPCDFD